MLTYTIPIAPITKKNHQQILTNKKTGRPFVMPSKQFSEYQDKALWFLKPTPATPISDRVSVKCLFYLPTRRKTDLTNLEEAIDDILVKAGILEDDNYTVLYSHDGSRVFYDKENPRTEIVIEKIIEET